MSRQTKPTIDSLLAEIASLKDHVAELAQQSAMDAANGVANGVSSAANHASEAVADKADEVLTSIRDNVRDKPIVSLLGAFALGMSMAGLLRR
jgi:ElaB/YqjD/DUF883 family membrane-anchored ribosome-binding protein